METKPKVSDLGIRVYQQIATEIQEERRDGWHASSIARCPRAQTLARRGKPPVNKPTGAKILRWDAGHYLEASLRPRLEVLMPELLSNIRLRSEKYDLTGEFDNYDPATKTLWEVKSVGPRAIRYRRKDEDTYHLRDDGPYLHHEIQQHAYVLLLEDKDSKIVTDHGTIANPTFKVENIGYIYVTLEGLLVTYLTPVKPHILDWVRKHLGYLNDCRSRGVLPKCVCSEEDHPLYKGLYQFCDYKTEEGCCEED